MSTKTNTNTKKDEVIMPLLEAGRLEIVTPNETKVKPLTIDDKLQIGNLILKILSELWFMVICSYVTYSIIFVFSYYLVHLEKTINSHNSIKPQSLSSDDNFAWLSGN